VIIALFTRYERVVRFVIVGGGVTLVYTALTAGLVATRIASDRVWASLYASLAVIPVSYLVHRSITYQDTAHSLGQWKRFAVIGLTNLLINTGLMRASELLAWPLWAPLMIGYGAVPFANFLLNTIWVFRANTLVSLDEDL
jgi:putative flippase GtrA